MQIEYTTNDDKKVFLFKSFKLITNNKTAIIIMNTATLTSLLCISLETGYIIVLNGKNTVIIKQIHPKPTSSVTSLLSFESSFAYSQS